MTFDAYVSHPHLADHLAPVWRALEDGLRGRFIAAHRSVVAHLRERHGIDAEWAVPHFPGGPVLVASYADYTQVYPGRRVAYLEHGAGQTYGDGLDWHPSYSGGTNRQRVASFLTLNPTTAEREQARYPEASVVVVGSPRLDELESRVRQILARVYAEKNTLETTGRYPFRPVVACAWHWNTRIVPETRTAWPAWRHTFADLARNGYTVLGHGHPRIWKELRPWCERHGIEPVADSAELLARADVLCFDNSSIGYEAAALGVPVVALNAPWYRRDVHHGLRFWDLVPGPQADVPDMVMDAIATSMSDEWALERARIASLVYPSSTRGNAARLAADACAALASSAEPTSSSRSIR
jgi:hypothetical protein